MAALRAWAGTRVRSGASSTRSRILFHSGWPPPLLLFLSFMMFSRFEYPSFKAVNWKTKKSIPRFLVIILVLILTVLNYEWMPAVLFLSYLLYGVLRPWLSREWRRGIEEEIGEEPIETTEQPS